MSSKLSTQPIKGFRDFYPKDWAVQSYIFDVWRNVCKAYGFEEYNGPVLENIEIYNKSGDDVGLNGKELYSFSDRGDRKIALRPEMTPTVGRIVAEYAKTASKPIRWFSIAQFFRAENPQRGRGREFFQLNADLFGEDSVYSDLEILKMVVDLMLGFKADKSMFTIKINDRELMNEELLKVVSAEQLTKVLRLIDAYKKNTPEWFASELGKLGLDANQVQKLNEYLKNTQVPSSSSSERLKTLFTLLESVGISEYFEYDPTLARGFDYYTGVIFEVFDKNPENNRSMFGGGRYDNLTEMFSNEKIPAVGFAPGDITTRLFLESWNLLPNNLGTMEESYYLPIMTPRAIPFLYKIAEKLRTSDKIVVIGTKQEDVNKALSFALKRGYKYLTILGEEELINNNYKVKNLLTKSEEVFNF